MDPLTTPSTADAKLHFLDYWRIIRIRKTVILTVFLLVAITATIVTYVLPESYASTVRIRVEKDQSDIAELGTQRTPLGYDPYFIQTEFEVIQSQVILHRVIDSLNLNERWAKRFNQEGKLKTAETYLILKRQIDVRQSRNTSLIEIRVFSENKEEAAEVANEVAKVYKDYRLEQRQESATGAITKLKEEWQQQDQKVRKAQEFADQLRKDLNITDYDASGSTPSTTLEPETLRRLEAQRIELQAQYVKAETLLKELEGLSREQLTKAIPTAAPDILLTDLLSQLSQAESRLVTLKKDYSEANPEVERVAALVKDLEKKVNDRVDGILVGLRTTVASAKAQLDSLVSEVENAKQKDSQMFSKSRPYWIAKRDLESEQRFREILSMKIAQEQIDLNLPKTSVVEIVDKAQPGMRPVKPNKVVNIALGIVIGLVVGVGLAFFIEYLDTSVKTIDDVERTLQAPVLGVIPQNVGYLFEEGAESPHAEAYRVLRTNLLFTRKDENLNTMTVVSGGAGEGKSTTVVNLATVFAQNGHRVVMVDSDLRRPTLHKVWGVSNSIGLTNYLLKQNTLDEVIQTTVIPTLDMMPSGKLPSSSLGILSSGQMKDLIRELKQRYDFVFFDSPPVMGLSDASILASEVDMTLQVVQYRRYPQPMTIRAKQLIEKVGGNLIGIVLNNINMAQDENYYYYSGYYHDYYSREEEEKPAKEDGKKAKLEIKQKY